MSLPPHCTIAVLASFTWDRYFREVICGINQTARDAGVQLIASQMRPEWAARSGFPDPAPFIPFNWAETDGYIAVLDSVCDADLRLLARMGKPLVIIGSGHGVVSCPEVTADDYGGTRAAVFHLVDHGHRRIAYVGCPRQFEYKQRYGAYQSALFERGIVPDPNLVFLGDDFEKAGAYAARQIAAQGLPCTAAFVSADNCAFSLMHSFQEAGYSIPDDLAIVSFDDVPMAQRSTPPLTTIRSKFEDFGATAATLLLSRLAGHPVASGPHYIPTTLVQRQSCGCQTLAGVHPTSADGSVPDADWAANLSRRLAGGLLAQPSNVSDLEPENVWPGVNHIVTGLVAAERGEVVPSVTTLAAAWCSAAQRVAPDALPLNDAFWVLEEATRSRAARSGDLEARARLERYLRLCHLELLRASQSIGDLRADTLENAAAKNHRLSATLLEASSADLHGLAWLSNTPVARACLARWEEPGEGQCWPDLTVTGCYDPSGTTTVAVGSRWPVEAFPPQDFVHAPLNIVDPGPVTLIPVRTQSSNWGILAFVGPVDSWLSRAEDLLLRLAALLPSALERDDLLRSLEQQRESLMARQKRLAALQSISGSLASMRTPSEIGQLVMSSGGLLFDAPLSRIRLLGDDGLWLVQVAATGEQGNDLFPARRSSTDDAPSAEAVRTRQPVWLESAIEMTTRFPAFAAEVVARGYQANAALPLITDERTVGTLGLLFTHQRQFSAEDREFLTAVAGMIAQALDKARLSVQEQARAHAAEDLARMRGDFVASVSHELRTPLTAIVGYAELLEVRWGTLSDDAKLEHVRRIVWSANRQMRLVQDLLLISRLDLQALSLDCTPTDLSALVVLAVTEVQGSYRGQQVQVTGPAGILVSADTARVVQILVNLLDNAAKYSPEGTQIEVRWETTVTQAVVRVRDHGPGIPAEGRTRLFVRFGRIAASRIRAGRVGTGLGLFLGRQLARAMAGDLDLESTDPQGSTFCLRLPLVVEEPTSQEQARTLQGASSPSR